MQGAGEKYRDAIELYKTTDKSVTEIAAECGLSRTALAAYIQRKHRDLMARRHGVSVVDDGGKLRKKSGQNAATHAKYKEAIEACDSMEYVEMNVSQIARVYNLSPSALANQLRAHYPDVLKRREDARKRLGLADNKHRGVRKSAEETYAPAIELLRTSDMSVEEAAEACGVSFSGLKQHLLFYHRDVAEAREERREEGMENPRIGAVGGNGRLRVPREEDMRRFEEAVKMYRDTSLSMKEIAEKSGVDVNQLRYHMMMWHRKNIFERRGVQLPEDASDREELSGSKRYSKASAEKYAEVIALLKTSDISTEAAAKKFGFVPEVLRSYLKEHEPELYAARGMVTLPDGTRRLRRSLPPDANKQ